MGHDATDGKGRQRRNGNNGSGGNGMAGLDLSDILPDLPALSAVRRDDPPPPDDAGPEAERDGQDDVEEAVGEAHGPRGGDDVTSQPFWLATRGAGRTSIPNWVPAIVAELGEALVLGQLDFWFDRDKQGRFRAQIPIDGETWYAETYAKLGARIGRTERQVQTAVRRLEKRGFVVVARHRSRYHDHRVVRHFRLDWARIGAALEAAGWSAERDDVD